MSEPLEQQNGSSEQPDTLLKPEAPIVGDMRTDVREKVEHAMNADIMEHVMRELGVDPHNIPSKAEFSSEAWTALRKPGDIMALKNALQAGITPEEAKRFLAAHIAPFITSKRLSVAARALVNTGIASEELCLYMANIVIDSLLFQHGHNLTEGLIRSELNGYSAEVLDEAISWMNRSSFEAPKETIVPMDTDTESEDEEEDIEGIDPISFSPDGTMKELWDALDTAMTIEQRDLLDAQLVDEHRSISTLLIVDAPYMEISVREFCTMEHHLPAGDFVISLDELEELLPVRFSAK